MADKLTGRASYFKINGVKIPITKYTPKATRELADDTDSANYDITSDIVHKSQTATTTQTELTVEGRYRLSSTMAQIATLLYTGADAVPVVLGQDAGTLFGHGNFDISDFSADFVVTDIVNWSATLKSNGVFTPGA